MGRCSPVLETPVFADPRSFPGETGSPMSVSASTTASSSSLSDVRDPLPLAAAADARSDAAQPTRHHHARLGVRRRLADDDQRLAGHAVHEGLGRVELPVRPLRGAAVHRVAAVVPGEPATSSAPGGARRSSCGASTRSGSCGSPSRWCRCGCWRTACRRGAADRRFPAARVHHARRRRGGRAGVGELDGGRRAGAAARQVFLPPAAVGLAIPRRSRRRCSSAGCSTTLRDLRHHHPALVRDPVHVRGGVRRGRTSTVPVRPRPAPTPPQGGLRADSRRWATPLKDRQFLWFGGFVGTLTFAVSFMGSSHALSARPHLRRHVSSVVRHRRSSCWS